MPGNGEEPGERQPNVGEVTGYGRNDPRTKHTAARSIPVPMTRASIVTTPY